MERIYCDLSQKPKCIDSEARAKMGGQSGQTEHQCLQIANVVAPSCDLDSNTIMGRLPTASDGKACSKNSSLDALLFSIKAINFIP